MAQMTDKVVLVTGGSAGLGVHIARALAQRGARVIIAARGREPLQATAERLRSEGGDVTGIVADITRQDQVDDLLVQIERRFHRLDMLVNNAGRSDRGLASETSPEKYLDLLQLNFLALVRCTQAALPHLIRSRGHLVNIGSLSSKIATPYLGAYPASKFAVEALCDALRIELRPFGIHVSVIEPGDVETPIWDKTQRYADELEARLSEDGKRFYGDLIPRVRERLEKSSRSASSPEGCARAIEHALAARRPKTRYLVGVDARIQVALARWLPDRWRDALLDRLLRSGKGPL